jgi:hypothetical protein
MRVGAIAKGFSDAIARIVVLANDFGKRTSRHKIAHRGAALIVRDFFALRPGRTLRLLSCPPSPSLGRVHLGANVVSVRTIGKATERAPTPD